MRNNINSHLKKEYEDQKTLFESQPVIMQRFLESQAQFIAEALITKQAQVRFLLPDRVVTSVGAITVLEAARQIKVGSLLRGDVRAALTQRLNELEKSQ